MKLNKKGFGVAEIAIVVLLIGILAAAVIAGFMGIKKNANDVADEQGKIAQTMSNDLKHSFPTILSDNLSAGLLIDESQYEVYEMAGYSIKGGGAGSGIYPVYNKGTLYITGNGTLDESSAINGNFPINSTVDNGYVAVENYGKLYLNDLVIKGGGNRYANRNYYMGCYNGSETVLDNVRYITGAGAFGVQAGATLTIKGTNSSVTLISPKNQDKGLTGFNLFYVMGTVIIEDGVFRMEKSSNTYAYIAGGNVTIKKAIFQTPSGNQKGFNIASGGSLTIHNGTFDCNASKGFLSLAGTSTATILGGEFYNYTANSTMVSGNENIVISGGAFAVKPKSAWLAAGCSVSENKQSVVCSDGVTRQLYVVTKNS